MYCDKIKDTDEKALCEKMLRSGKQIDESFTDTQWFGRSGGEEIYPSTELMKYELSFQEMQTFQLRRLEYCQDPYENLICLKFTFAYEDEIEGEKLVETPRWGDQEARSEEFEVEDLDLFRLYVTRSLLGFDLVNKPKKPRSFGRRDYGEARWDVPLGRRERVVGVAVSVGLDRYDNSLIQGIRLRT